MNSLQFIRPSWPAPSAVKALVTTRTGGVSQTPFKSLNVGMHVDDQADDVLLNRQRLSQQAELPSDPVWLNQVHGTDILNLDNDTDTDEIIPDKDGVITSVRQRVCAIMTADCLPLFLCDRDGRQIALLHVGWQGMAKGIIARGVELFKQPPHNIIAWAGPCISQSHFIIGKEVRDQLGGTDAAYRPSPEDSDKVYADLYKLAGERLAEVGVNNYWHSNHCTYSDDSLFYSYRRENLTGRMVSLMWID